MAKRECKREKSTDVRGGIQTKENVDQPGQSRQREQKEQMHDRVSLVRGIGHDKGESVDGDTEINTSDFLTFQYFRANI